MASNRTLRISSIFKTLLRLVLVSLVMFLAYILGTQVFGETEIQMTPEEAAQAGMGLVLVSLVDALVLAALVLNSRWHGLRLIAGLFLVHFGVETFMAQIETLYFNDAVQMEVEMLLGITAAGALRALIFAPLAVLILGRWKGPSGGQLQREGSNRNGLWSRLAGLAVFYALVYFVFGYAVAWQWEETRLYYSGTTAIKPIFQHFRDLFLVEDPFIIPFQLLRGILWAGLAYLIVRMVKFNQWKVSLAVAATFVVLLGLPLGVFPNFYMPARVAQSHFIELTTSMWLFGGIAGWVLYEDHL